MKKNHYLYECVRFGEDKALRFIMHALCDENIKGIAYSIKLEVFNPHHPINPRKSWFRYSLTKTL